ncbi:nitroreductase family protein [Arenicella sp. 4NH20-0111]|uniref:nitroreductase family protein n=1 Tax=Arenicella sp. 4NH20-0111 TaxID=3127648 RepID=UPI0033409C17
MTNKLDFSARDSQTGVAPLFVERWSPRAFEKVAIEGDVLKRIFDAARWSPSCFNAQPWRFYTSTENSFAEFLDLLVEGNQGWAKDTSVIGFLVAEKNFEHNGKPNAFAQFDSGAAWMGMTLQARMEGLYTHGMGGIHADKAADYLGIDTDTQEVIMGFTIGKLAQLTQEQAQVEVPNERKALDQIWFERES